MNLVKRNKYYHVWFSRTEAPPNGKLVSLKKIVDHPVTTKEEAEQVLAIIKKNHLEKKIIQLESGPRMPLDDFAELYTSGERADLSPKTLAADKLALKLLGDVIGKKKFIRAINRDDLIKFKNDCRARNLKPDSIKSYLRHIKAALNYAKKHGFRDTVPEIPKIKTPRRLPHAIPSKTLDDILTWAKENDYELWRYAAFSLWTGCRRSEIMDLKHQNIQIYDQPAESGVCGSARIIGKGDKERTVYLLPGAIEAIGQVNDIGPVFTQWHKDTVGHRWKEAVRGAGYETPRFHDLRHTAAVRMIEKGINLKVVQQILGHADITTTLRYTELFDNVLANEMGKML